MHALQTISLWRLITLFGMWALLAAAWVVACMWIESDERAVFGRSGRWKSLIAAVGIVMLLGSCLGGSAVLPLIAFVLPCTVGWYLACRERAVPSSRRIFQRRAMIRLLSLALRIAGLQSFLERLETLFAEDDQDQSAEAQVVLLKKDGSACGLSSSGADGETAQAIQVARKIVGKGIILRATDIHFEPKAGQEYQVRYRIDGMLQTRQVLDAAEGRSVVSALKVLSDMDISERRRPQDGGFVVRASERRFDVRAASGPTNFGEKMSLRMLDADGGIVKEGLSALGMRKSTINTLRDVIHRSHGMLIVCGPTGSGKTTTVYGAIGEIDTLTRNVVTIEDPVEYRLPNISQTAVNNAADLTFAKILRSVLRQDPDVILVGEIRDRETAEIAMQAALTGHFVFTTLHANDSATTITRLLDIGIDATLIQSAVTAVLAQRLVRVLCPQCKEAYKPSDGLLRKFGIPAGKVNMLYKERGCQACHGTGYNGRTGVYELMVLDTALRTLLVGRPSLEAVREAARNAGMKVLWHSVLNKVVSGTTSLAEAERVVR